MRTMSIAPSMTMAQSLPSDIKNFGRTRLSDVFEDWVIYRNLEPLEKRLPGLKAAAGRMNISDQPIPRKQEEDYAKAANWFIQRAQQIRKISKPIRELLFIGDSLYNDGQAYRNMVALNGWQGSCFIGAEQGGQELTIDIQDEDNLYLANRWSALASWAQWLLAQDFALNEQTAVIVDIDKTVLGAKGRNDHAIDRARLEGIYRTMDSVLGDSFDQSAFERQYAELNRSAYHCLTADNQDYLAYICLMLNARLIQLDEVVSEVQNGNMDSFEQFARWVNTRLMINPTGGEGLRQVHETVMACIHVGDPTPFKRFRRYEFMSTVARMGSLSEESSVDELLEQEITITHEVRELSEWLRQRGCLLLCMSDKPDEASCPDRYDAAEFLPVHKMEAHSVGSSIQSLLDKLR